MCWPGCSVSYSGRLFTAKVGECEGAGSRMVQEDDDLEGLGTYVPISKNLLRDICQDMMRKE